MQNFGLGLIGAALEGGFLVAPLIVDTVEQTGLRLRAIYDPNEFDAKEVELVIESKYDRINIPQDIYLTGDLQYMFADFMLDVMLVANPAAEHRAMIETALAGFEKVALTGPIALTMDDANTIVAASQARPILVNLPRRFEAGWQKAHELLQSGLIGTLQYINLRAFLPETNYLRLWERTQTNRDEIFLGKLCGYMDALNWFAGAACVSLSAEGDSGVHDLDDYDPNGSFRALFKQLPIHWRSRVSQYSAGEEVDEFPADEYVDHASARLRYGNGVIASLTITSHGPAATDAEDLDLVGDKGRIWFNAAEGKLYVHFWNGSDSERLDNLGDVGRPLSARLNAAFLAQLPGFIEGKTPQASAVEAAEALRLALGMLDSIRNGGSPVLMGLEIEEEPIPEESVPEESADTDSLTIAVEDISDEGADGEGEVGATEAVELKTGEDWEPDHPAVEDISDDEEPLTV